jgi:hypothetical protein
VWALREALEERGIIVEEARFGASFRNPEALGEHGIIVEEACFGASFRNPEVRISEARSEACFLNDYATLLPDFGSSLRSALPQRLCHAPRALHVGPTRFDAKERAFGFRKLAPGCNASILAGSAFLHPKVSFRNPEARFWISEAFSKARFLNEPAPSRVPRVEWWGALPASLLLGQTGSSDNTMHETWHSCFSLVGKDLNSSPLWVRLCNVPLGLWIEGFFLNMGNHLYNFISMDPIYENEVFSYAT